MNLQFIIVENVIRQDYNNAKTVGSQAGRVTIKENKRSEKIRTVGRTTRVEDQSIKDSSMSTGFEIPSAGEFGDPRIAAFPEFGLMLEKIFPTEADSEAEDASNNNWEFIEENKNPNVKDKLTKSKTVSRDAKYDMDKYFEGSPTIGTDFYEHLDYGIDSPEVSAVPPQFPIYHQTVETQETPNPSKPEYTTSEPEKVKKYEKIERYIKSDEIDDDKTATFTGSNTEPAASSANSNTNSRYQSKQVPLPLENGLLKNSVVSSVETSKQLNSSVIYKKSTTLKYHRNATAAPELSVELNNNTDSLNSSKSRADGRRSGETDVNSKNQLTTTATDSSNAETEKSLYGYFKKWKVTAQSLASTDQPLETHNRSAKLESPKNSTTLINPSIDAKKLNRSSKDLNISHPVDAVDEILHSKQFLDRHNSTTDATTASQFLETSPKIATVGKLKKYRHYMAKYNVTKSSGSKAQDTEYVGVVKNGTSRSGKKKDSLKVQSTGKREHQAHGSRIRISKDGRRRKNHKKKADPYKNVKVESELFDAKRVVLPKRLKVEVPNEMKDEKLKAAPNVISQANNDPDDCSRTCSECLKKLRSKLDKELVNSVKLKAATFGEKSNENIDSGLTETNDNQTLSSSPVESNPVNSNEAEWITTTTKKFRRRKKSKRTTIMSTPTTTVTMATQEEEASSSDASTKATAKPSRRRKDGKGKRIGNGKGQRRRKTTEKMSTTEKLEVESTMEMSSITSSFENQQTPDPKSSTNAKNTPTPISESPPTGTTCGFFDVICELQKVFEEPPVTETIVPETAVTTIKMTGELPDAVESTSTRATKECDDFFGCEDDESSGIQSTKVSNVTEEEETAFPLAVSTTTKDCDNFVCWVTNMLESRISSTKRPIAASSGASQSSGSIDAAGSQELDPNESSAWEIIEDFPSLENKTAKAKNISGFSQENVTMTMDVSEEIIPVDGSRETASDVAAKTITESTWLRWDDWIINPNRNESSEASGKETSTQPHDSATSDVNGIARTSKNVITAKCRDDEYHCDRNRCINKFDVCNGINNCYDGTDEDNCHGVLRVLAWRREHMNENRCRNDQHPCDESKCLEIENTCDGIVHCEDGSDETDCLDYINRKNEVLRDYGNRYRLRQTMRSTTTMHPSETARRPPRRRHCWGEFEYECNNGECIAQDLQCDGYVDCIDGEDEDPSLCRGRRTRHEIFNNIYVLWDTMIVLGVVKQTEG